jgi:hypothetical protein
MQVNQIGLCVPDSPAKPGAPGGGHWSKTQMALNPDSFYPYPASHFSRIRPTCSAVVTEHCNVMPAANLLNSKIANKAFDSAWLRRVIFTNV